MRDFNRLRDKSENHPANPIKAKGQNPNGSKDKEVNAPKNNANRYLIYTQPKAEIIRSILAPNPKSSFKAVIFSNEAGLVGRSILISGIATSSAQPTSFGAISA
jgi:hypothetical protein